MKNIGSLFIVAVLASLLTAGILLFSGAWDDKIVTVQQEFRTPIANTNYDLPPVEDVGRVDFKSAAKLVTPAVVHIKSTTTVQQQSQQYQFNQEWMERFFGPQMPQERGPDVRMGTGSGVIISGDGYVVTNNHVIDRADYVEVTLNDNRSFKAKVVGVDPSTDLAVLKIEANELPHLEFANSDLVEIGEWVMAVGNPFNLNSTVTAGIVSAKARNINILKDKSAIESFIQTDAAINPGNSGGALCALDGKLIGINTAIASPTGAYSGYGFAVPANMVNKVVEDLIEFGVVQRAYLGVYIRSVDANLAKEKDLDTQSGVYVDKMMDESAAKSAGVEEGDVILKVDGIEVQTSPELQELIGRKRPGDEVSLEIDRGGDLKTILVKLKNRNGKVAVVTKEATSILDVLGVDLEEVDKALARKMDIEGGLQIKALRSGKLKKHTSVREGFVITKIDGKTIESVEDLEQALKDKKGGVMMQGLYEGVPGVQYYAFGMDS